MPVNLSVQADVIDISTDSPQASDIFLVDTNVWYWTAYSKASLSSYYRSDYDAYLKKALVAGAKLYVSGLSQSELMHSIERTERELFNPSIPAKEFRHNHAAQRTTVVTEVTTAWGVVKNIAEIIDLRVDAGMTQRVITRCHSCAMDGYDLISAEAMFQHAILQVLTDDGDFAVVGGVRLFTANRNVLTAARSQGRLLVR
jgi:hypothetical protein